MKYSKTRGSAIFNGRLEFHSRAFVIEGSADTLGLVLPRLQQESNGTEAGASSCHTPEASEQPSPRHVRECAVACCVDIAQKPIQQKSARQAEGRPGDAKGRGRHRQSVLIHEDGCVGLRAYGAGTRAQRAGRTHVA